MLQTVFFFQSKLQSKQELEYINILWMNGNTGEKTDLYEIKIKLYFVHTFLKLIIGYIILAVYHHNS